MIPSTPVEAMAEALHRDRNSHVSSSCDHNCATWVMDLREAEGLVESLGEIGWHLGADLSLPTEAPKGDPYTTSERITDLESREHAVVLTLYRIGRGTSELVWQAYNFDPPQSEASIRTRLVELERAGLVRRMKEIPRRPTRNGGTAVVWTVTDKAREQLNALGVEAA